MSGKATQSELAGKAATSQPAIAAYESDTKSPTWKTIQRLARSVGLEAFVSFVPPMTREDRLSMALHAAIARVIAADPEPHIVHAKRNLRRLRTMHPHAGDRFARWLQWLEEPIDDLIVRMLDPGSFGREMRHVSPFSGVLSARDRARILAALRVDSAS